MAMWGWVNWSSSSCPTSAGTYAEYAETTLNTPLKKGCRYTISFDARVDGTGSHTGLPNSCLDFGIAFYNSASPPAASVNCLIPLTPAYAVNCSLLLAGTYQTFTFTYVPPTNMDVLIIGPWQNSITATCTTSTTLNRMYFNTDNLVLVESCGLSASPDTTICFGDSAVLRARNDISYWWSTLLAPTDTLSTDSNLVVSPTTSTVYLVHGDTATEMIAVTVDQKPVVKLRNDTVLCLGPVLTLKGENPGANYSWSTGQTTQNIQVDTTGTYWVDVSYGGCTIRDSTTITFNKGPVVDLGPDSSLCVGDWILLDAANVGATYLWHDGSTNQWFTAVTSGTYWATASRWGCSHTDTINLTFDAMPSVDLGQDTTFCSGGSITLDAENPGASYTWSTGDTTQTLDVTTSGNYIATAAFGACADMDTVNVSVIQTPVVNLGPDLSICGGDVHTLDAGNPGSTYLWSPGGEVTQTIQVTTPGTYIVFVSNQQCTESDTLNLSVDVPPVLDLGVDTTICDYESVFLNAGSGLATYSWSTGQATQAIIAEQQATYWVTGVDANGCQADTAFKVIWEEQCDCVPGEDIFLPNLFTPSQTLNSRFYVRSKTGMTVTELKIFNRWGELVFEGADFPSNDISFGWDGTYKGQELQPQTFAYYVRAVCGNEEITLSGNVTILR
jgi:gliding motility-associated-like protein